MTVNRNESTIAEFEVSSKNAEESVESTISRIIVVRFEVVSVRN